MRLKSFFFFSKILTDVEPPTPTTTFKGTARKFSLARHTAMPVKEWECFGLKSNCI
jgi:hypothetical protein